MKNFKYVITIRAKNESNAWDKLVNIMGLETLKVKKELN